MDFEFNGLDPQPTKTLRGILLTQIIGTVSLFDFALHLVN